MCNGNYGIECLKAFKAEIGVANTQFFKNLSNNVRKSVENFGIIAQFAIENTVKSYNCKFLL